MYDLLIPIEAIDYTSSVILELTAGAGGIEAALFAGDLLKMYESLALKCNWTFVLEDQSSCGDGSASASNGLCISHARIRIHGNPSEASGFGSLGAYGQIKSEAGVHRVQRVPVTSKHNKIHTSTVAVSVLPVTEDVCFRILRFLIIISNKNQKLESLFNYFIKILWVYVYLTY